MTAIKEPEPRTLPQRNETNEQRFERYERYAAQRTLEIVRERLGLPPKDGDLDFKTDNADPDEGE